MSATGDERWKQLAQLLRGRAGWKLQAKSTPGAPPAWCFEPVGHVELSVSVEGGAIAVYVVEADLDVTLATTDELTEWLTVHWPGSLPDPKARLVDRLKRDQLFRWD